MNIKQIEGVGPSYALRLTEAGIRTTEILLQKAANRTGRKKLARNLDISERKILDWVNRADLMRIQGVGEEYSDLLEAAGVDSVRELRTRRPENLYQAILEVNRKKALVRRPPSVKSIARWVEQAKELVPLITH
jgi:predicted flap endonuclease-1-like 5' DNA nuclease